jgi:hypothetical protein
MEGVTLGGAPSISENFVWFKKDSLTSIKTIYFEDKK